MVAKKYAKESNFIFRPSSQESHFFLNQYQSTMAQRLSPVYL